MKLLHGNSTVWKMPKYCKKDSLIRIFSYMGRIVSIFLKCGEILRFCPNTGKYGYDSVHIQEYTNQRKAFISAYFTQYFAVLNFYNGLTWKHKPFGDIEKFRQPPAITPLQLLLHLFVQQQHHLLSPLSHFCFSFGDNIDYFFH